MRTSSLSSGSRTSSPSGTSEVDRSEKNRNFIDSIGNMGHLMDCEVILEGVETESQLKEIRHIACDYIQGYYFTKPLPEKEFVEFIIKG